MSGARVLVAGLGNIFLGDDGFGCAVARRLIERGPPADVKVRDLGLRSLELAYELLEGYELAIFIDAMPRSKTPGALTVLEPSAAAKAPSLDGHQLCPDTVLETLRALGGAPPDRVLVVGCEPSPGEPDPEAGLSGPVAAAVDPAADLVLSLIAEVAGRPGHA